MGECQTKELAPQVSLDDSSIEEDHDDLDASINGVGRSHRQKMARHREADVSEFYDTHLIIGQGSMGEVSIVIKKQSISASKSYDSLSAFADTGQASPTRATMTKALKRSESAPLERTRYACKTVNTIRMKPDEMLEFLNEIDILRDLDHPNIVQLFEVYTQKRKIWIITELCSGGDLSTSGRDCSEAEVTVILEQTLLALAYMHKRKICHRDIKLENIMYADKSPNSEVKLIDFGLSNKFTTGKKMLRECGTVYTAAPEVLVGQGYTEKTDVWSVGVVAFVLLSKAYPFLRDGNDMEDDFKLALLRDARFTFGPEWKMRKITKNGKKFVSRCFKKDPDARWTASEALDFVSNKWVPELTEVEMSVLESGESGLIDSVRSESYTPPPEHPLAHTIVHKKKRNRIASSMLNGMSSFVLYGELKKTILMTMAYTMDKTSLRELKDIFIVIDTHGKGTINLEELKVALSQMNSNKSLDDETIEQLFKGIDLDHSGQIHYMEFLAAVVESQGLITIERLAEAFDRLDQDGKGYISKKDLQELLGTDYNEELVQNMINEADFKKSSQVDYEAFLRLMLEDPSATMGAVEHTNLNEDKDMAQKLGNVSDMNLKDNTKFRNAMHLSGTFSDGSDEIGGQSWVIYDVVEDFKDGLDEGNKSMLSIGSPRDMHCVPISDT